METTTGRDLIKVIRENSARGHYTYVGDYVYCEAMDTGAIYACERGKEDKEWYDEEGNMRGYWYLVSGRGRRQR